MKKSILAIVIFFILWSVPGFSQEPSLVMNLPEGADKISPPAATRTGWESPALRTDIDSLINLCIAEVNPDTIEWFMQSLQDFDTRFALSPNRKQVASWIQQQFIRLGYANTVLDSFQAVTQWIQVIDTTWQYNVIATLEGSQTADIDLMLGGHYDAVISVPAGNAMVEAPGADDNASSIAAAYEVARIFKLKNIQPRIRIKFCAWACEELGLRGSVAYMFNAIFADKKIKTYLNNDMISYEPSATSWTVNVNEYDGNEWLGDIAEIAADQFTELNTNRQVTNSGGSDSYAFYLGGYPTIYFAESNFNPHYHTPGDTVGFCNIPYASEIVKFDLSMMLWLLQIPSLVKFEIFNPGDGISLEPRWKPNPENDIVGYQVNIGRQAGIYDTSYFTTDTSLFITNLKTDTLYFIAISAVNTDGLEGPWNEKQDIPEFAPMNQGILIVDDSEGGINYPSDSTVDAFYDALLANFQHDSYDANATQKMNLGIIGKYSSLLWHVNRQTSYTMLRNSLDDVRQYLQLGGNILFSLYQPTRVFDQNQSYPAQYIHGFFAYDYTKLDHANHLTGALFNHAVPATSGYVPLQADTMKLLSTNQYHLPVIEALYPTADGQVIYTYGSGFAPSTTQGAMQGMPVAIESMVSGYKTVLLSFPLYYMDLVQAKDLVNYVIEYKFQEMPIGLDEHQTGPVSLLIWPNPADDIINIELQGTPHKTGAATVTATLYNFCGSKVMESARVLSGNSRMHIDIRNLPPGIYMIRISNGTSVWGSAKVIRK